MHSDSEPWQIAAARFCVERSEFTLKELETFLEEAPHKIPHEHVRNFFIENIQNPAGRQFNREFRKSVEGQGGFWTAPPDLVSMITDYDELRHARLSAKSAWRWAVAAFVVSSIAAVFQA